MPSLVLAELSRLSGSISWWPLTICQARPAAHYPASPCVPIIWWGGQVTGGHWSAEQECVLATGRGQLQPPLTANNAMKIRSAFDLRLLSCCWSRQCSAFSCCIQDSFYLAWYLLFVNASTLFFVRGDDFQNPGQVRPQQITVTQPRHYKWWSWAAADT